MKKFILILFCGLNFLNSTSIAGNASLFVYDEVKVERSFANLKLVEDLIFCNVAHSNNDFMALQNQIQFSGSEVYLNEMLIDDGYGALLLGCCLGPIGLAILLASGNDQEMVYKGALGCMVPSALVGIGIITKEPLFFLAAVDIFISVWD